MTTAIVGVSNIGGALARHLVAGGESVVLAAKDGSLADELGPLTHAASVENAVAGADAVVFALWLDTIKELIPQYARLLEDAPPTIGNKIQRAIDETDRDLLLENNRA
jgi:8-hydroxy-5-deazaflavin:NADPH oxidoreductase